MILKFKLLFKFLLFHCWSSICLSLSLEAALIKLDPEDGEQIMEYLKTHALLTREKACESESYTTLNKNFTSRSLNCETSAVVILFWKHKLCGFSVASVGQRAEEAAGGERQTEERHRTAEKSTAR